MSSSDGLGNVVSRSWRWIPAFWELSHRRLRPKIRLMLLALLVGIVSGAGAIVFYLACQLVSHYSIGLLAGYVPGSPGGEKEIFKATATRFLPWMLIILPAIGGLISGIIVFTFAPEAEGHGTDAAIDAYHHKMGYIRPRVPLIKLIASAITLGSGGSGGREGPIAQIGAGFGSFLGGAMRLRPVERRVLMAAGMGAGVAAIFRAPLAGALFAAEVLYKSPDFESDVIMPAGLASVSAYCTFGLAFGWNPLFTTPPGFFDQLTFNNPWHLLSYTVLALFMVLLAMLYTRSFYGITGLFHKLKIKPHFKPAIGALLTGLVGVGLYYAMRQNQQTLAVMSFGYGILQDVLTVNPTAEQSLMFGAVLLAVAFGKILTTGLTIGSGGSGGVFGPSMVIGGCGGGALGIFLHHLWPAMVPHPATFGIIGMAGFFAAAAKTPFSTLVIVSEMTGGYALLLPTMWVCALAYLLSDERSIYKSQIDGPSLSPAHQGDYVRAVLTGLSVGQLVEAGEKVTTVAPGDSLAVIIERLAQSTYGLVPVVDAAGKLAGVVSLDEVHVAAVGNLGTLVLATDLMRTKVEPLQMGDRLDRAVELFAYNDLEALPVLAEGKLAGMVRRSDVANAYLKRVHAPKESEAVAS